MPLHSNQTTNKKQRLRIQNSDLSYAQIADKCQVSKATVHRFRHRDDQKDRSCAPKQVAYALSEQEQALVLFLRSLRLALDAIVDAVDDLLPHLCRSSVYRLLRRQGLNRLPALTTDEKAGQFKEYGPGYLHLDTFTLPTLEGQKRYGFVAVDRATRLVFLAVYESKDAQAAKDFLERCLAFFPFRIEKILTDNGFEYTAPPIKKSTTQTEHAFEALCQKQQIQHRRIRPGVPRTNGMAERMVGVIKQAAIKQVVYPSAQAMLESLRLWHCHYHFYRRHPKLARKTPYQSVCDWFEKRPDIFLKEPARLLQWRSHSCET